MPKGKPSAPRLPVRSAIPTSISHVAHTLRTSTRLTEPGIAGITRNTCNAATSVASAPNADATTSAFHVEAGTEASH
jgi:hypothetical protein